MPDQEQPKRNTDERIDAISMNLELLSHEVAELGIRTESNARAIEALAATVDNLAARLDTLASHIDQLTRIVLRTDSKIEKLADLVTGIVQNHDRRIAALESRR